MKAKSTAPANGSVKSRNGVDAMPAAAYPAQNGLLSILNPFSYLGIAGPGDDEAALRRAIIYGIIFYSIVLLICFLAATGSLYIIFKAWQTSIWGVAYG